jgi:hypothetical protein
MMAKHFPRTPKIMTGAGLHNPSALPEESGLEPLILKF